MFLSKKPAPTMEPQKEKPWDPEDELRRWNAYQLAAKKVQPKVDPKAREREDARWAGR